VQQFPVFAHSPDRSAGEVDRPLICGHAQYPIVFARDPPARRNPASVLILKCLHDPELKIVQITESREGPRRKEFVYRTNGAGETNPPVRAYQALFNGSELSNNDPDKVPSTSEWHGKKLRTVSAVVIFIPDGKQSTVKTEAVWEMSSDGETLVQTITFTVERGPLGEIQTFHFVGGGHGHGVGMCQSGATRLATSKTYKEILAHSRRHLYQA